VLQVSVDNSKLVYKYKINTSTDPESDCSSKFQCGHPVDKQCIPFEFVCDGELDCVSGNDEKYCTIEAMRSKNGETKELLKK
jgi:hypothetical protein